MDYQNNEGHNEDLELPFFDRSTIVCATKNFAINKKIGEGGFGSVFMAWILWNEGKPLELLNECLGESCTMSEVLRCIRLSLLCMQERPKDRPSMSSIIVILGSESALPQPKQPSFFLEKDSNEGQFLTSKHC
ncbi:hypothetical protein SO802_027488 [Lithocarpus litseifolius]|uniref:S-locus receptor kinase C-terminal domain-containing protein n=1 Tax=Lithocarpus litseifolius TaxID=425828 RepID=A0AAW2C460_9ROSI